MKTIELTKEEVDKLVNGENVLKIQDDGLHIVLKDKVEQWEPKGGNWIIDIGEPNPVIDVGNYPIEDMYIEQDHAGLSRKTKEQAERAAKKMRAFNRLLAYVDEFDPDFKYNKDSCNYYVFYDYTEGKHSVCWSTTARQIGVTYMSKEVAEELCRKLNSGEVCL